MNKISQAQKLVAKNSKYDSSSLLTILQLGLDVSRNNAGIYLLKSRTRIAASATTPLIKKI